MVTVELGGQSRPLWYNMNAICRLKAEHGVNLLRPEDQDTDDPVVLRAVVWAGLIHADPMLTVEEVGTWIGLRDIGPVSTAFLRAIQEGVRPQSEAGRAAANPPDPDGSSGTTCSASATASVG